MRQLLIDELSADDVARLNDYLKANAAASSMEGLYWVEIGPDLLDEEQRVAAGDQPFRFAIEVGESWAKFELLVRSRENMRSPYTRYANRAQRGFVMEYADRLIEALGLRT